MELVDIPNVISDKILRLTKHYSLYYSTMDLIFTPEKEYVFLEVNPNGQYLWTEELSGCKITEYFADFLGGK